MSPSPAIGTLAYDIRGKRYLNLTSRCTLRCRFCPKFNGRWDVQSYALRLRGEPDAEQVLQAIGDPDAAREIVFCGLGEPTLRLDTLLQVSAAMQERGQRVRVNTDGLGSLYHGRNIMPQLKGRVDALSISLNAQNEALYMAHCRPTQPGSYGALLEFIERAVQEIPEVTVTAIDGLPGVEIEACEEIATQRGARFRRRVLDQVG